MDRKGGERRRIQGERGVEKKVALTLTRFKRHSSSHVYDTLNTASDLFRLHV